MNATASPIRVLLAEDHELVRAGIGALLRASQCITVVAETANGHEALREIERHKPDIALLDIQMPGLSGLAATEIIARDFPATRAVILSMQSEADCVVAAMRAGARGYLLKDTSPRELVSALQSVARGEVHLCPAASHHLLTDYTRQVGALPPTPVETGTPDPLQGVSPRQREVLELIARGKSTREMAEILFISPKTVETHRAGLMQRLGIRDVAGLVRFAIQHDIISLDTQKR